MSDHKKYVVENREGGNGEAIATYARVSTGRQRLTGASLDAQEEQHKPIIEQLNPTTVHHYRDEGISGTDFQTRGIVDILTRRQAGEISKVVTTNIDRLGREALGLLAFAVNFAIGGGLIITPAKTYDCRKHDDLESLVNQILAAAREVINRTISTEQALKERWRQRRWCKSQVPFGYVKRDDGWIQIIPELFTIVEEIYELCTEDMIFNQIAKKITREYGHLLGEIHAKYPKLRLGISDDRIRSILSDPVYIGKPTNYGQVNEDPSLVIVPEEVFRVCQDLLDEKDSRRTKPAERTFNKCFLTNPIVFINTLSDFVDTAVLQHRGCGGRIVFNGNPTDMGFDQSLLKCLGCGKEPRFPSTKQFRRINENVVCNRCNVEIRHESAATVCRGCFKHLSEQANVQTTKKPSSQLEGYACNIMQQVSNQHEHTVQASSESVVQKVESEYAVATQAMPLLHVQHGAQCDLDPKPVAAVSKTVARGSKDAQKSCANAECNVKCTPERPEKGHFTGKFSGSAQWYCHNCYSKLNMRIVKDIRPASFRGRYGLRESHIMHR